MCRCRLRNDTVSDATDVNTSVVKGLKVALLRVDEERRPVAQGGPTNSPTSRAAKPLSNRRSDYVRKRVSTWFEISRH